MAARRLAAVALLAVALAAVNVELAEASTQYGLHNNTNGTVIEGMCSGNTNKEDDVVCPAGYKNKIGTDIAACCNPTVTASNSTVTASNSTVTASSVSATLTIDTITKADAEKILANPAIKQAFIDDFKKDIATLLGVDATQIKNVVVTSGSLIVKFDVEVTPGVTMPDVETALNTQITFTNLGNNTLVTGVLKDFFSKPVQVKVDAKYTSSACDSPQTCTSNANCAPKHTGYQCECKPGYETTPTPNIKDTCAKPTTALKNGAAQAGLVSAAGMVAAMTLFM